MPCRIALPEVAQKIKEIKRSIQEPIFLPPSTTLMCRDERPFLCCRDRRECSDRCFDGASQFAGCAVIELFCNKFKQLVHTVLAI